MTARDDEALPSLAINAFELTGQQLDILDDRIMNLLVFTDLLVAERYDLPKETKKTLMRVLLRLRSVRFDCCSCGIRIVCCEAVLLGGCHRKRGPSHESRQETEQ